MFMKLKNLLFLSLSIALFAPSFLSGQMAKKYVMFEHFTQASCGPCASQNPIFDATRQMNIGNVHHVAYHTYWPGVDPMYDANTVEQDDMITTYSVTAVPTMFMNLSLIHI